MMTIENLNIRLSENHSLNSEITAFWGLKPTV
jgi:hypothetical protein